MPRHLHGAIVSKRFGDYNKASSKWWFKARGLSLRLCVACFIKRLVNTARRILEATLVSRRVAEMQLVFSRWSGADPRRGARRQEDQLTLSRSPTSSVLIAIASLQ